MKASAFLYNAQQGHVVWSSLWREIKAMLMAGHRLVVEIKPETRSNGQNARMWACLAEISRQVVWHGHRLTAEEWKDVFSASLKEQKVVPGLHGRFVVCGQRTSKMSVREMSDMLEIINAFAAEHNVELREPEHA